MSSGRQNKTSMATSVISMAARSLFLSVS
jgi:hypothetical protein